MRDAEKATLRNAVNETFSADVHLQFETVPAGEYAIDLSAGGQRIGWGIQEYIKGFQEKARTLMIPPPAPARTASPPAAAQAPVAVPPAPAALPPAPAAAHARAS
jgi:F-type H+-transporting ATPase subunit b